MKKLRTSIYMWVASQRLQWEVRLLATAQIWLCMYKHGISRKEGWRQKNEHILIREQTIKSFGFWMLNGNPTPYKLLYPNIHLRAKKTSKLGHGQKSSSLFATLWIPNWAVSSPPRWHGWTYLCLHHQWSGITYLWHGKGMGELNFFSVQSPDGRWSFLLSSHCWSRNKVFSHCGQFFKRPEFLGHSLEQCWSR